jgi:hypothetical protein
LAEPAALCIFRVAVCRDDCKREQSGLSQRLDDSYEQCLVVSERRDRIGASRRAAAGDGPAAASVILESIPMKKLYVSLAALAFFTGACTLQADDPPKKKPDPAEQFKKLDKNTDSKLSFEEFKGKRDETKAKAAFDKKDANKDGFLSLEEFKATPKKKTE